jgi:pimeloyl-ACP methyl ester carboxylesterase
MRRPLERTCPQAFLVGKDFGAMPAYEFALQHPDRTCGVVCLGIPFSPVPFSFDTMPEGFYVLRWGVRACHTSESLMIGVAALVLRFLVSRHHQFVPFFFLFCRSLAGRRPTSPGTT